MGFMDKVKEQAALVADKAQEVGKAGQGKLEQVQGKRRADALLLELGGITYRRSTGYTDPGADDRATELITLIGKHEAEHGPITVTSADDGGLLGNLGGGAAPAQQAPAAPSAAPPPASAGGPLPQGSYGSEPSGG